MSVGGGEMDDRIPCPDDLCTGTINESGVCGYCGRAGGELGAGGGGALGGTEPRAANVMVNESGAPGPAGGDDERVPCADDLCVGTIGERGVCNYCGKPAR